MERRIDQRGARGSVHVRMSEERGVKAGKMERNGWQWAWTAGHNRALTVDL
jgi:hypothetical protein